MIPKDKVVELVDAHGRLAEPTTGAIWIHPEDSCRGCRPTVEHRP